jgi:glutaminyl-peptide cyclotransferase
MLSFLKVRFTIPLLLLILTALPGCDAIANAVNQIAAPPAAGLQIAQIVETIPHDNQSFTQGFLIHEGTIYESAGRYGESSLREVDLETGEVLRSVPVPAQYFAEGLALVDDRLIQITWREGTALVYDLDTFELIDTYSYTGEGWGLCYNEADNQLYMSDGSAYLFTRDPETFEVTGQIHVTVDGEEVVNINELECVGDRIYANVWQTDAILEIDKATGHTINVIYGGQLLTAEQRASLEAGGVLNGIAYDADNDAFYLTGKLFPAMWQVEFIPVERTEGE